MAERDLSSRLRRAVQENNLPLVRRLVQRTGMRNPDPDHKRYTSLAWAASLGNEETFEFLLGQGHDDEERSLDIDNDTILILLAETKGASVTSPYRSMPEGPTIQAALRMARLYHERYPETKDWSNHKGRTALHVAALKGNEELSGMLCDLGADYDLTDNDGNTPLHYASAWGHVPIVQLLIERGCQYTVKNNDGFTASDYAYSYNTKETLQSTARAQYETLKNKRSKRNMIQVSASRNGSSRELPSPTPPPVPAKTRRSSQDLTPQSNRIRSGSGASASFSTGTSDSGDYVDSIRHKPSYSSLSTAASSSPSDPLAPGGFFRGQTDSSRGSSSNGTLHSPGASNASSLHPGSTGLSHALSPVATRMRAQDADAMEKYMASRTRGRSGSADTGPDFKPTHSATPSNASATMAYPNYMSSGPSANGDDISALENMHLSGSVAPRRRLRPSQSASQLNATPSPPLLNTNVPREFGGARARAGTTPVEQTSDAPLPPPKGVALTPPSDRMLFNSPTQATPPSRPSFSREDSSRRERQDYTGPSRAYATFPEPPPPTEHSKTLPPIVPAPLRRETAENVKTPTQPSARRMPFKLTKGSSGSIDNSTYRNGTLPPPPAALPNRGDGKF